jgi:hypothetical protein
MQIKGLDGKAIAADTFFPSSLLERVARMSHGRIETGEGFMAYR